MKFVIDGVRVEFDKTVNSDNSSQFHKTNSTRNQQEIIQPTEMAETVKEINNDDIEGNSRMSKIDMKARISMAEAGAILAFDTLVQLKFLPKNSLFLTRQRKRLSVSEEGKGRTEIVEIVRGIKEQEINGKGVQQDSKGLNIGFKKTS